jgi:hypothetical protein
MDVDASQGRMAAFVRDRQDKIVGRWTEIVALGIEFGDIATKATLADALVRALRRSGRQIRTA